MARIGQSLAKRNSVLMEENSKLEAMLGSAREEVTGQGGGVGRAPSQTFLHPLRARTCACPHPPRLPSNRDPLPHWQILHLRRQVSLRDDLLQLYSDSDEEEEEEEDEEEEEGEEEEEEQQHDHPYGASEP